MNHLELGWVVGLFEGEGTIAWQGAQSVQLRITMTDEDIVQRVHELTGVGQFTGPRSYPNRKPIWTWVVSRRDDVRPLLELMIPHLGRRRRLRAEEAITRIDGSRNRLIAICGTISGYNKHRLTGEPYCDKCRAAHAAAERNRLRAKRLQEASS